MNSEEKLRTALKPHMTRDGTYVHAPADAVIDAVIASAQPPEAMPGEEAIARAIYAVEPDTNQGEVIPWEELTEWAKRYPYRAARAVLALLPRHEAGGETSVTDEMIAAFALAADGLGAHKGSLLWDQYEKGFRAIFAPLPPREEMIMQARKLFSEAYSAALFEYGEPLATHVFSRRELQEIARALSASDQKDLGK